MGRVKNGNNGLGRIVRLVARVVLQRDEMRCEESSKLEDDTTPRSLPEHTGLTHRGRANGKSTATEEVAAVEEGVDVERHDVSASHFAPIATGGNSKSRANSVEQSTEDRDLRDAVVASLPQTRSESLNEDCDGGDDVRKDKKKPYSGSSVTETGQPSNSKPNPSFICEICAAARTKKDLFRVTGCDHACCNDCVTKYVTLKLHDNVTRIDCPVSGCGSVLEPDYCSSILPPEVFDRWGNALCEALILEAERFYCPFKDCSALIINDGDAVVRDSECPNCWRLFCAQCRVPWHAGLECKEFQGLNVGERVREDEPDPTFVCEICVEPRTNSDLFCIKGCSHSYCHDCVTKYVASKLQDNVTHIDCLVSGCGGLLEPEYCRSILPPELFDRWGNALCEALILEGERFYCPFKDCSALLINDGGMVMRESECPNCRRLFCVQCRVPWHAGVECGEFQKLKEGERGREDIMLMELAEKQQWRRCPKCSFYVQKSDGCSFVNCRCGVEFCYRCGAPSKTSHYCTKCLR